MKSFFANWQPKLGGIVAFLAVLFAQLNAAFDNAPETIPDWNLVVAAGAALFAALTVRQANVSSERSGAN